MGITANKPESGAIPETWVGASTWEGSALGWTTSSSTQQSTCSVAPARTSLTSLVVLVVDDEPSVLVTMARTLLEVGYTVYQASSGQDALTLPQELAGRWAALLFSRGFASKFLFVSGYGPAADYNEEFGPFLLKPFSHGGRQRRWTSSSAESCVGSVLVISLTV